MKRKMAMLEQAHGLLCNVPGDGGSAEDGEQWRQLRQEWIDRWYHLIKDQRTKEHNRHVSIGNEAITEFEAKQAEPVRTDLSATPPPLSVGDRVAAGGHTGTVRVAYDHNSLVAWDGADAVWIPNQELSRVVGVARG